MIISDEKILREKCDDANGTEVGEIIEQLERELAYSALMGRAGVGLAAPQCAIKKNVAIVRIDDRYKVNLVNCKIEKAYDLMTFEQEGCLSMPGKTGDTKRHQEIYVVNNLVYPHSFIATGLMAVVIQHEIDHMNGVLFTDRVVKQEIKKKLRPNDLCFCGSSVKYKRCHGVNK